MTAEMILVGFAGVLAAAAPVLFAVIGETISERAGVIDIGLEGKMLFAAFVAGAAGVSLGSVWLALLLAMAVTVALSWLHGLACVSYRGDQVVSGVAINISAAGMTAVLGKLDAQLSRGEDPGADLATGKYYCKLALDTIDKNLAAAGGGNHDKDTLALADALLK